MKIRPVTTELLHAGGQADRHDKANRSFPQFLATRLKIIFLNFSAVL